MWQCSRAGTCYRCSDRLPSGRCAPACFPTPTSLLHTKAAALRPRRTRQLSLALSLPTPYPKRSLPTARPTRDTHSRALARSRCISLPAGGGKKGEVRVEGRGRNGKADGRCKLPAVAALRVHGCWLSPAGTGSRCHPPNPCSHISLALSAQHRSTRQISIA